MTVAHVYTVAFQGIDAREVDVQVHISDSGGGQFNIVGLADKAVAESRERVRAAVACVLNAALAAAEQNRVLICPAANGPEAAFAGCVEILATPSLIALVNHMKGA